MISETVIQLLSIVVVVIVLSFFWKSKNLHFLFGGLMLIVLGFMLIQFEIFSVDFDWKRLPVVYFGLYLLIAFAGKDLLVEGFKQTKSALKYQSLGLGSLLVLMGVVPVLSRYEILSFVIPNYNIIVDGIIYVLGGLFLLFGKFILTVTNKKDTDLPYL